jgi:thiopurine S-methyltransferase
VTGRDNQNWLKMWRNRQTDFHQHEVNPLLKRFWSGLQVDPESRVFVPLCGKSLDLAWLAAQGHQVVGVELSPVAAKAFFEENGLAPTRSRCGDFTAWSSGRITILCGDYFRLAQADLGPIDTVYDRAALTALPEDLRERYVAQLRSIVPPACTVFLLTVEDEAANAASRGDDVDAEICSLYGAHFDIQLAHGESLPEEGADASQSPARTVAHKVYRLRPAQQDKR